MNGSYQAISSPLELDFTRTSLQIEVLEVLSTPLHTNETQ